MAKETDKTHVTDRREFLWRVSGTVAASGVVVPAVASAQDTTPPPAAKLLPTISALLAEIHAERVKT